jgi:GTP-binding protein EngB required for normal cell division
MFKLLGPLMDLLHSRENNDREVFKSMYEKHGGHHVVYAKADEGLAARSRERRLSIEKTISQLRARLGEPNDSHRNQHDSDSNCE